MKLPPEYKITSEILDLIAKIEANKIFISSLNISNLLKEKIQRTSTLKSSLFSARIEGNPLTLNEIQHEIGDAQKKQEIFNILKAIKFIDKNIKTDTKISEKLILNLHSIIMQDLTSERGEFRREVSAIFNQAGVAVYLPPPPAQIKRLIKRLLNYLNSGCEKFPLINAFISHLIFEKIHPFINGNGRVGRLLIFSILKSKDENYNMFVPFEEYLDENRNEYYYHLDNGLNNTQDYLIFMLNAFYFEIEQVKKIINSELEKKESLFLPPRQEEIYHIIKDHVIVSFDMIRRRFLKVPGRTIRYDLKKLQGMNLIIKIGKTKGSYYKIK